MIARLRGRLLEKSPDALIVEVGGIGLAVTVSLNTLYELPEPEHEVDLFIHTHLRENTIQLIGFGSREEREAFRSLLNITGIGPRLAITILSGVEVKELYEAIINQDRQRLNTIPGVGKKLAERIILELKDKIPPRETMIAGKPLGVKKEKQVILDVLSAMVNLGYKKTEAEKVIEEVMEKEFKDREVHLEALLKASLRQLVKEPQHRTT